MPAVVDQPTNPTLAPLDVDADVVIVGAGVAGLVAARELFSSGRSALVLEARSRVGGRLSSPTHSGVALDVGATWFWPNESRIQSLISDLGIETHGQHIAGDAIYHDPAGTQRIRGNPIDVPAGRFTNGAQALAGSLAALLPEGVIKLDHVVTQITSHEDGIAVVAAGARFTASHVVLAVPPALAVSALSFDPPLDNETLQVARATPVWMGGITKVVACYAAPFWRERGLAGAGISHAGPIREMHDMSGPEGAPAALFGFVPPTQIGGPTVTSAEVLDQLVEMLGPEAANATELLIHDWRTERYTSPPEVEAIQNHELFGHRRYQRPALGGRMHWASTETSRDFGGHIEGAIAAASRAVDAIRAADEVHSS